METKIFPIKSVNSEDIHDGDMIEYNSNTYIVMYNDKSDTNWDLYPCGNTQTGVITLGDINILIPITLLKK